MGKPMARNLLRAGFEVTVHSRTQSRVDELVQAGARAGAGPADVAARSELVVTIVPDSSDVEQVATGPGGVLESARSGLIVADMSTISPAVTRTLAARAASAGTSWLDAPVSGGEAGAIAGTLTIMVGGDAATFERALPVFQAMGKRVTHIGPSGHGQLAKLCNQILVAINLLGASEALVFAAKAGLDLDKVHGALSGGAANSWAFEHLGRKMLNRDLKPAFKVALQQKDSAAGQRGGARDLRPRHRRRPRPAAAPRARSAGARGRRHSGARDRARIAGGHQGGERVGRTPGLTPGVC